MIDPWPPSDQYLEGQRAADLELWLHQRKDAPYEVTVTYRSPDSQAVSNLGTEPCPTVSLDTTYLLGLSLDLTNYGRALTKMLFADERLRMAFAQARSLAEGAQAPLRVRLRLDADDPALHSVRWEALLDPTSVRWEASPDPTADQSTTFLCPQAATRFSRFFASSNVRVISAPERAELTALVAIAAPNNADRYGLAPIDPTVEQQIILPALGSIKTRMIEHATLPALIAALQEGIGAKGVDIFYLIAHGGITNNVPCLYLEDADGNVAPTNGEALVTALDSLAHRPLLTVLASCQSAGTSHGYGAAHVALGPRIAEKGIGAVIAMHDNIAIATVTAGLPILFKQLQAHGCVDLAMAEMRATLAARDDDWWQPVLYMRLTDGRLWRRPASEISTSGSFIRISELGADARETLRIKSYDDLITIGRKGKSDLQFDKDDPGVSWEHGQIIRQNSAYYYRHLSNSGKTELLRRGGREAITFKPESREEQPLGNQDRLKIGSHTFVISHTLVDEDDGYIATKDPSEPS
jgi:hypothetical protein